MSKKICMSMEIKALLKKLKVVFFAGAMLSPAANAMLVSTDHSGWGVDSITLDTHTGMRWLDINHSTGFSYHQVLAEMLAGGVFEGFRYATQAEFEALAINSGVVDFNDKSAANTAPALDLMAFLGSTQIFRTNPEIFGMTGSVSSGVVGSAVFDHVYSGGAAVYDVSVLGLSYGMDYSNNTVGNWLVTTTEVPLPPAFLLFSSALALFGLLKRNLNRLR